MVITIFASMHASYVAGCVEEEISYYFSVDEVKRTVFLTPGTCVIKEGKIVEKADCVCKTTPELFVRIWEEGYRPGMKDFLSGGIKSNNPGLLQEFLVAFGK